MPIKRSRATPDSNPATGRARPLSASLNTYGKRGKERAGADTEQEDSMQIDKSMSNHESSQDSTRQEIQDSQDSQIDFIQENFNRVTVRGDSLASPRAPKYRSKFAIDVQTPTIIDRGSEATSVLVMGNNDVGQLGLVDIEEASKPVRIPNLDKFKIVDISVGCLHTVALTRDGKVVTWGCNDHGALGRVTTDEEDKELPPNVGRENVPDYAQGLDDVTIVKVACGGSITLALSDDGQLYMAGTFKDKNGVLGFSAKEKKLLQQSTFIRYDSTTKFKIADIATGTDHALLLTTEGFLYAWGSGDAHQLGRRVLARHVRDGLNPEKIAVKGIEKIFAGAYHSFAVAENGPVYAWGMNNYGQCGIETRDEFIRQPIKIDFFKDLPKVQQIAAGEHHSLVLLDDGSIYSFGRADYGQLGIGDAIDKDDDDKIKRQKIGQKVVTPTKIKNLAPCTFIATGDHHSIAVSSIGGDKVFTWGFGESYALGGGEEDKKEPYLVVGKNLTGRSILAIGGGSQHTVILIQ
ncbi:23981_t:CDS:2 [Dentiscutata erythropus]|uniref:23981_t:CDS:1 n=1 Tax=Dentiscutata erythropus TaxID=1348616 RepID=A0A9N9BVE5_9GLOM|nr:23981_t:CDS:2 [Dentiscutata erythropus]